jgi:hypothetical protein
MLFLQVGEFVEVSNNSKTDPCAWVGCVETIGKKCLVSAASNGYKHESKDLCPTWNAVNSCSICVRTLLQRLQVHAAQQLMASAMFLTFHPCMQCTPWSRSSGLRSHIVCAFVTLRSIARCVLFFPALQINYPFHDSPKELIKVSRHMQ